MEYSIIEKIFAEERNTSAKPARKRNNVNSKILLVFLLAAMVSCAQACVPGPDDPTCCP
jgi:hypothetical protein